ncbi:MAG: hypothetical protein JJ891_00610 [Rhizobiaceae bacterium]|jgi:hypothetical protein|nr:hypothetical protein [Rhizobiaceae bacterium]
MLGRKFLLSGVIYGLIGLAMGLHMAITHDHGQMPTHAHIQVIGWLSFFAFGVYYKLVPAAASGLLAVSHFCLAQVSAILTFVGLWFLYGGYPDLEPVAAIGGIAYSVSFILFAIIVYRTAD